MLSLFGENVLVNTYVIYIPPWNRPLGRWRGRNSKEFVFEDNKLTQRRVKKPCSSLTLFTMDFMFLSNVVGGLENMNKKFTNSAVAMAVVALGVGLVKIDRASAAFLTLLNNNITVSKPAGTYTLPEGNDSISLDSAVSGTATYRVTFQQSDILGDYKVGITESLNHGQKSDVKDSILTFTKSATSPKRITMTVSPTVMVLTDSFKKGTYMTTYSLMASIESFPTGSAFLLAGETNVSAKSNFKVVPEPSAILGTLSALVIGYGLRRKLKASHGA